MCLTGPLAAISPMSMIANKVLGRGLLGKKKAQAPITNNYYAGDTGRPTAQGTTGPSPSYYGG